MEEVAEDSEVSGFDEYKRKKEEFLRSIPTLKDWVDSWPSEKSSVQTGYYYFNIFGYYWKKKEMGGYGAILRDPHGRPVIAFAKAQAQSLGRSHLYHVLDGVNDALSVALKRGIHNLELLCNTQFLNGINWMFHQADLGDNPSCSAQPRCEPGCTICLNRYIGVADNEIMYSLLVEIQTKRAELMAAKTDFFSFRFEEVGVSSNKAAYRVAQQHEKEFNRQIASPETMYEPATFSNELKKILWDDCFGGNMKFSEQILSSFLHDE